MKKLILASVFALSITPAFAQQMSQQELCLDMAAATSTIAIARDEGYPADQFVVNLMQALEDGKTTTVIAEATLTLASMLYNGEFRNLSPSEASVVVYRRCMGSGI